MLETITSWLSENGDYDAGLELLKATGYTGFALTILSMGDDAYNRTRLEKELRTWCEGQHTVSMQQALPGSDPPMVAKNSLVPLTVAIDFAKPDSSLVISRQAPARMEAADPVAGLKRQIGQLMDQRNEAVAWLRHSEHLGNDESAQAQRRPYAYQVKQITCQIDELYSQIDFYQEHGYLPLLAPVESIDERSHLLNIRSNVSRYKKRLAQKNLTPEQRQAYQAKYDQYMAEKQRLETKQQSTHDLDTSGQQTSDSPIHSSTFS